MNSLTPTEINNLSDGDKLKLVQYIYNIGNDGRLDALLMVLDKNFVIEVLGEQRVNVLMK